MPNVTILDVVGSNFSTSFSKHGSIIVKKGKILYSFAGKITISYRNIDKKTTYKAVNSIKLV